MTIVILQPDNTSATIKIQRYEPGKIWVNQQCYEHSLILRPHQLQPFNPTQLNDVLLEHFKVIFDNPPQILILGTGKAPLIPKEELLLPFFEKGIGVEFMDSKTACYTFTVLAAEERDVAACILII